MPIRFAVEQAQWVEAASISPPAGAPLQVIALAIWARGLGLVHDGKPDEAQAEADKLQDLEDHLRTEQQEYWSVRTGILKNEILGWISEANGDPRRAASLLHACADQEDAIEKLPVTPGPIFPAREQLGSLLLEQHRPALALKEFRIALANAPGRRSALEGLSRSVSAVSNGKRITTPKEP
ncbi:MAG TPA: hypothetical protein VFA99_15305 [Acidobacteriaceae bacterium]|nr:hypothetical protein [Acidobacteriaceae bacterium]